MMPPVWASGSNLPPSLNNKRRHFLQEKLKSPTQDNNKRQVFVAENATPLTTEPAPSTEATKDKEQNKRIYLHQ
jgi:hypothetical protein